MKLRLLSSADAANLLIFERENRHWFEQFIPARDAGLYTEVGIDDHIRQCLDDHRNGKFYPGLLVGEDGNIIGRANLRDINTASRSCKIGYRIASNYLGQGAATQGVSLLIQIAKNNFSLTKLSATVLVENIASMRVLEKNGFCRGKFIPAMSLIGAVRLDGYEYNLDSFIKSEARI